MDLQLNAIVSHAYKLLGDVRRNRHLLSDENSSGTSSPSSDIEAVGCFEGRRTYLVFQMGCFSGIWGKVYSYKRMY